jgi:hypothetical protein
VREPLIVVFICVSLTSMPFAGQHGSLPMKRCSLWWLSDLLWWLQRDRSGHACCKPRPPEALNASTLSLELPSTWEPAQLACWRWRHTITLATCSSVLRHVYEAIVDLPAQVSCKESSKSSAKISQTWPQVRTA